MTKSTTPPPAHPWADDALADTRRLRIRTYWNMDYFANIVLPLLDLAPHGHVLDVGCGSGGLSFLLAELLPDLRITGVDQEPRCVEDAASCAARCGFTQVRFEQGDAHRLRFDNQTFDAVVCQTLLTHVRDARVVVGEMARVLKSGGVLFAAEFTNSGAIASYDSVHFGKRDEAWYREYYRISGLYTRGKQALGRGDNSVGVRVPWLVTQAGLDVYDVRLNDRVAHAFPPYSHQKQRDYLELRKAYYTRMGCAPDSDDRLLRSTIETIQAGGGTEADGRWFHAAMDYPGVVQAIEEGRYAETSSVALYLTFARKAQVTPGETAHITRP